MIWWVWLLPEATHLCVYSSRPQQTPKLLFSQMFSFFSFKL
jgi:hypothetical protein